MPQLCTWPSCVIEDHGGLPSCHHDPTADRCPLATPLEAPMPDPTDDDEQLPFRLMGLSCDHPTGCDADLRADVRADTRAQAFAGIRDHGRAQGWQVSDDAVWSYCPAHRPSLLGVPEGGPA